MQYFKPAAGIVVLIFVLLILYIFIVSGIEKRERETSRTEQQRVETAKLNTYNSCLKDAETRKSDAERVTRSIFNGMINSGEYDRQLNECNTRMLPPYSSDQMMQTTNNLCKSQIETVVFNQEKIDNQYQTDKSECQFKYGR